MLIEYARVATGEDNVSLILSGLEQVKLSETEYSSSQLREKARLREGQSKCIIVNL
jgi:hypothetical protein